MVGHDPQMIREFIKHPGIYDKKYSSKGLYKFSRLSIDGASGTDFRPGVEIKLEKIIQVAII